jgi:gliding motility-associated-like protein
MKGKRLVVSISLILAFCASSLKSQTVTETFVLLCSGIGREIGIPEQSGYTYVWSPSTYLSNAQSSLTTITITNAPSVTLFEYSCQLQVFPLDSTEAERIYNYTIYVVGASSFVVELGERTICDGDTVRINKPLGLTPNFSLTPANNYIYNELDSSFAFFPSDTTLYNFESLDSAECSVTNLRFQINVNPVIQAFLSTSDSTFCFSDTSSFQLDYSPSNGVFSGAGVNQDGLFTPSLAGGGFHEINYRINASGCITNASVELEVISEDYVTLSDLPNTCQIDTLINLDGGFPAGGIYTVDGQETDVVNPSLLSTGQHVIVYTYNVEAECIIAKSDLFFVIPLPPTPTISAFPDSIACYGDTIVLSSSLFTSYLWNTGETTKDIAVTETATYSVSSVSSLGCKSVPVSLEVSIGDSLQVDLSSELYPNGYEVSTFEGSDGRIELQIEGGLSPYEINLNDSITIGSFVNGLKAGFYTVYVRDRAGCLVSDSIRLFEAPFVAPPSLDFSLPNAFTPNGDGFNDTYKINKLMPEYVLNRLSIWDISRRLVFSAENYDNTWSGLDNSGKKLPAGTYFAVFESEKLTEPVKTYIDLRYE